MGDLRYNDIISQGSQGKQHPVISLKKYSESLVEYERVKEKEAPTQKSYTNNWKKKVVYNILGEPTNKYLYRQESSCINIKDIKIRTICNYSLKILCFSIHLPETDNFIKMLNQKKYNNAKVQFVSKNFNYVCTGEVSYHNQTCIYPIVSIPLDVASRYLQKPEFWTCKISFLNFSFEFNLTGNLPASWS